MKVAFVTKGRVYDFLRKRKSEELSADVVVFSFNGLGVVSYKKELEGKEDKFVELAKLSKELNRPVLCGCDTDTFGVYRRSVAVADGGRLLGVSDCLNEPVYSEFKCGSGVNSYKTSRGRIGVIVDKDVYDMSLFEKLSHEECDVIICVMKSVTDHLPEVMIRAGGVYAGVSAALCSLGYYSVTNAVGEIIFSGHKEEDFCEIPVNRNYVVMSYKKRSAIF